MGNSPDVLVARGSTSFNHTTRSGRRDGGRQRFSRGHIMASATSGADPIKVGVIADQTGPLSFVGLANANVARMVIGDINAKGGLLGRQLELHLEAGATDDAVASAAAARLVERDNVD